MKHNRPKESDNRYLADKALNNFFTDELLDCLIQRVETRINNCDNRIAIIGDNLKNGFWRNGNKKSKVESIIKESKKRP